MTDSESVIERVASELHRAREIYFECRIKDPQNRTGNAERALGLYRVLFVLAQRLSGADKYESLRLWRAEEAVADHIAAGRLELLDHLAPMLPRAQDQSYAEWRDMLTVTRESWRPGTDEKVIMTGTPFPATWPVPTSPVVPSAPPQSERSRPRGR